MQIPWRHPAAASGFKLLSPETHWRQSQSRDPLYLKTKTTPRLQKQAFPKTCTPTPRPCTSYTRQTTPLTCNTPVVYLVHLSKRSVSQIPDNFPAVLRVHVSVNVLILLSLPLRTQLEYFPEIKESHCLPEMLNSPVEEVISVETLLEWDSDAAPSACLLPRRYCVVTPPHGALWSLHRSLLGHPYFEKMPEWARPGARTIPVSIHTLPWTGLLNCSLMYWFTSSTRHDQAPSSSHTSRVIKSPVQLSVFKIIPMWDKSTPRPPRKTVVLFPRNPVRFLRESVIHGRTK